MPNISPRRDIVACFGKALRVSAGTSDKRWVVIIAPDGTLIKVPVLASQQPINLCSTTFDSPWRPKASR